ncbi:hypothetical protein [Micromonospora sp. RTGN7]|uniref:hypothetical protein n=1 Tax=Micromonospora sp. RTGN7 TaxID=3016526 RepID=UPI0029FF4256|nr:hypothetical protein [Micromonospora sp. RTGN7]
MSTTVTITVTDTKVFGVGGPETKITVTRPSRAAAIAEALTMTAAAHRPEMDRAWTEIRDQVEPLLAAYREVAAPRVAATEGPV